ncbi:alpha/beta fold hydrolase [Pseudonocardia sp. MH-G8]|uniref:alpha/beta fold hydrolase n=1 Tax=Pseudonocardia sp. MH-G8 TaxID=1854588 RepID=UPI00130410DD|nr:alpha/beta hydrolase [Pseudonocardia sp. MH-G8]
MTQPTVKTVHAGGYTTAYLEAGDPAATTVVLVHDGAYGTTAQLCWGPLVERLAPEFHVLAPDLLGWGGTDKVVFLDRSPYAFRVPHVAAFCEELGVDSAAFVGASFGGSLLLRALADPGSPWPVTRAVSVSGTGGPFRLPEGTAALGAYEPSIEGARTLTGLLVADLEGLDEHIEQRYRNSLVAGHFEAMQAPGLKNPATTRTPPPDPFLDQLATVETPLLLVEGRRDQLLETGWSKELAGRALAATAVETDYAHEPNIDAPDALADLILPFLRGE